MGTAANPKFTRAEFEELKAELSMLDVYRARNGKDKSEVGLRAYYEAARRLGLIVQELGFEEFLERMPAELFNEVMGRDYSRAGVPNSPAPENSGESMDDSSESTASDLETSSS